MNNYKRFTKKGGLTKNLNLTQELGYSHIYNCLAELEDRIESGELGNVTAYKHRIEVLEKALKNVINEYTYDGEVTVPGCEECDIAFGRPSKKCLQTQFDRLIMQAEKELKEEIYNKIILKIKNNKNKLIK